MNYVEDPTLIVGNTGAGKSTAIASILGHLLRRNSTDTNVLYYDAKACKNVINLYENISDLCRTVDERLRYREHTLSGKSYEEYKELNAEEFMPRIVVVIDNYDVAYDNMTNYDVCNVVPSLQRLVEKRKQLGTNIILSTSSVKWLPIDFAMFINKIILRTNQELPSTLDSSELKEPGECLFVCGEESTKANLRDL